jgi:hypothetical protein
MSGDDIGTCAEGADVQVEIIIFCPHSDTTAARTVCILQGELVLLYLSYKLCLVRKPLSVENQHEVLTAVTVKAVF